LVFSSAAPCKEALIILPTKAMLLNMKSTSTSFPYLLPAMADKIRFMQLSYAEVTYFIEQVGMSAASFGVATEDVMLVGTALMNAFGYRCEPPMTIVPAQGPQLQSICDDETCPLSPNATCASYNGTIPKPGNATIPGSNSTATSTGSGSKTTGGSTATGSAPVATVSTAAGATVAFSFAAVAGGLAAMFL
jgi:hypothetical protein